MIVRQIPQEDLAALLELYRHLHEADDQRANVAMENAVWEEICANPRYRYVGAYVGDLLVASCTITLIPNLTRACRPYGVIENVVTHADYRGKGIGREVLKSALNHAWANDCYKVMLLTGRLNEQTFRFYESAGFDRHGKQAFIVRKP